MRRYLLGAAVTVAALAAVPGPAAALMVAPPQPGQMAVTFPVVLTGTVTSIENDLVEVPSPYAGATDKQKYRLAVVKVDAGLAGIDGTKVKEVKVGVFQPAKPAPNAKGPSAGIRPPRGPAPPIELKEGQELLLFLVKHPSADFYFVSGTGAPVDLSTPQGKKTLDEVKRVTAVLADPMKALKSDKAEVRAAAAAVMVMKYRAYPVLGGQTEQVAIGADESKLILAGLAGGEWKAGRFGPPNAFTAFGQLGLTPKDGWVPPVIVAVPGQPAPDYALVTKDAFAKWLDGPGKDYVLKKIVTKTVEK